MLSMYQPNWLAFAHTAEYTQPLALYSDPVEHMYKREFNHLWQLAYNDVNTV